MFHLQVTPLKEIFEKNGYPENFIDKCFKLLLNKTYVLKEKVPSVENDSKLGLNCKRPPKVY